MTNEIERVGIPVAQIAAVVDIAKSINVPRLLRGFAITCPVGIPTLGDKDEKDSRRKYVEKALQLLQEPGEAGRITDI